MKIAVKKFLVTEAETVALGAAVAQRLQSGMTIYLRGDLGMGKTTFSRGFMHALGHTGAVKSPTYTLIEPYELTHWRIYHFDLYRLVDPEELEYMGIRDYFNEDSIRLIEWPERGFGILPPADLVITFESQEEGRIATIAGHSAIGEEVVKQLT